MIPETNSRRGFLKGLAAVFGGIGAMTLTASPAQAGRSHWRGGYGGYGGFGYGPVYRRSGRRFYGGGYGGYGGYGGGYYGAPRFYGGGYGGGYGNSYIVPAPVVPVQPYLYNGYYGPVMKRDATRAIDALSLLEA